MNSKREINVLNKISIIIEQLVSNIEQVTGRILTIDNIVRTKGIIKSIK